MIESSNSRFDQSEERIYEAEDKAYEIIKSEEKQRKINKEWKPTWIMGCHQGHNLCIIRVPKKEKEKGEESLFKEIIRASLVVQRLRIHLPMQGIQVWALVREDPTCCGATKPVCHNYWTCALEPLSHNYQSWHITTTEAHAPRARAPQQETTTMRSPHTEKRVAPAHHN